MLSLYLTDLRKRYSLRETACTAGDDARDIAAALPGGGPIAKRGGGGGIVLMGVSGSHASPTACAGLGSACCL